MTVHLPVVSSAAQTDFVSAELVGPDGVTLYIDGNQKISGWNPKPNAFSLVQIEDCPMSTATCRASCYVHGLEANAKTIHDRYRHNSKTIREIIASPHAGLWARLMADWITENAPRDIGFRWHVSGDLFSPEYTSWVATVMQWSPDVRHWIYTRSFPFTAAFVGLKNVSVNYSVDQDNYEQALQFHEAHLNIGSPVRLAYLVTGDGVAPVLPAGSVLFPDYNLRGTRNTTAAEQRASSPWWQSLSSAQRKQVCPIDFYGKAETLVCGRCTKCMVPNQ